MVIVCTSYRGHEMGFALSTLVLMPIPSSHPTKPINLDGLKLSYSLPVPCVPKITLKLIVSEIFNPV